MIAADDPLLTNPEKSFTHMKYKIKINFSNGRTPLKQNKFDPRLLLDYSYMEGTFASFIDDMRKSAVISISVESMTLTKEEFLDFLSWNMENFYQEYRLPRSEELMKMKQEVEARFNYTDASYMLGRGFQKDREYYQHLEREHYRTSREYFFDKEWLYNISHEPFFEKDKVMLWMESKKNQERLDEI
jgi:hypothetical protein